MIRKVIFLTIILVLITGCWDSKDITEQSLVVGVGIDKGMEKEYKVTLQIVKPSAIYTNGSGGSNEEPYWVHSTEGDTIFEAIRNQLETVSRKPYFSHNQIIIICEDIARKELSSLLDLMERDTETRLTYKVLIAKDTCAEDVLRLKSNLEVLPAVHISQILDNSKTTNKLISATIIDLLSRTSEKGFNSVIGVIEPNKTILDSRKPSTIQDMKVEGAGVFKDDKLIGWLGPIETRGLQFISGFTGEVEEGLLVEPAPHNPEKKASIEIIRLSSDIEVKVIDGELEISIKGKGKGILAEQQSGENLNTEENLLLLEKITEEKIKKEIELTINSAQKKFKSDFIGISNHVMKQHPQYWKVVKGQWNEVFPKLDVSVNISFEIDRTGLSDKPILEK